MQPPQMLTIEQTAKVFNVNGNQKMYKKGEEKMYRRGKKEEV